MKFNITQYNKKKIYSEEKMNYKLQAILPVNMKSIYNYSCNEFSKLKVLIYIEQQTETIDQRELLPDNYYKSL